MDGAIILASDASRIARANVHLVPNPNVPTSETGTRHRTAERVARSIDVPVVSVSEDMAIIAVYVGDEKHPLEAIPRLLVRANQALQTLERYRDRLDGVTASLSALEVEDLVTVRDVVNVLQRTEMVRRIADEIVGRHRRARRRRPPGQAPARGADGRRRGRPPPRHARLLHRRGATGTSTRRWTRWPPWAPRSCSTRRRWPPRCTCRASSVDLDAGVQPRGYRLLARIPRLPESVIERIVDRFGTLQKIMRATIDDLDDVTGVGATRARAIKEGLSRLAESSILDRYSCRRRGPSPPTVTATARARALDLRHAHHAAVRDACRDRPARRAGRPWAWSSSPTSAACGRCSTTTSPGWPPRTPGSCAPSTCGPGATTCRRSRPAWPPAARSTTSGCWATRWPRPTPRASSRWRSWGSAWAGCTRSRPPAPGGSPGRCRSTAWAGCPRCGRARRRASRSTRSARPGACPALEIAGTVDPWVPADDLAALEAAGVEVVRYEGADHGFAHDPSRPAHRPGDAADAWRRAIAHIGAA